jgi:translation initiation factor IF-2
LKKFDIELIKKSEKEVEELAAELRKVLGQRQAYYTRLTGISKQFISVFVSGKKGMGIDNLIHIYTCIQEDDNDSNTNKKP